MTIRYAHTNIVSEDWRALAAFYERVFDCVPIPPERNQAGGWLDQGTGLVGARLQGVHLRLPGYEGGRGPTLEIFAYEPMKGRLSTAANRKGIGHIAFEVDDVPAVRDRVLAHGGSEVGSVATTNVDFVGTLTFVYVADPEGNIIEIQNWS